MNPGDRPGLFPQSKPKTSGKPAPLAWLLAGTTATVLAAASILLGRDTGSFSTWVWISMAAGVCGGGLVVATVWAFRRCSIKVQWILIAGIAGVCFRMILWPADNFLSDDAFRYHWDGKVLSHGINPFQYAPNDPELHRFRTHAIDDRINHPDVRTVYPPAAQLYFVASYVFSPGSLLGFKLLVLISELSAWLLILVELRRRGLPRAYLAVAIAFPVLTFENYLPGHLDALALPWFAWFVSALGRKRPVAAGVALAVSCLIKPLPVIFIPAALKELGLKRSVKFGAAVALLIAAGYLPFASAGKHLFSSMWLMASSWSFNASVAALLEATLPRATARIAAATTLAALVTVSVWMGRDLMARLLMAAAAFVICTAAMFPWYAAWFFPLLALRPDPSLLALMIFLPISEHVVIAHRQSGMWDPKPWTALVQYIPFYGVLLWSSVKKRGMFSIYSRGANHEQETTHR